MRKNGETKEASVFYNVIDVMKTLFSTYKSTRLSVPVYIICKVLLPFMGTLVPAIAVAFITKGFTSSFIGAMVSILILYFIIGLLQEYSYNSMMNKVEFTRLNVYFMKYIKKVFTTDYQNVDSGQGQQMIMLGTKSVISKSLGSARLSTECIDFLIQLLGFLSYGTVVLALDYRILLVMLFTFGLDLILRGNAIRYTQKHKYETSAIHRKQEYLERGCLDVAAGKDVRIFQMEGWFHHIFSGLVDDARDFANRSGIRWYYPTVGNQFCVMGREILTYFVLIGMVISGKMDVAAFTFQLGLVRGFSDWMYGISVSFGAMKSASHQYEDYKKVLAIQDTNNNNDRVPLPELLCGPKIEFQDVSFRYPFAEENTISHMNLVIQPGEKIALVGSNGAGKTTFVKLLCGLYKPTEGRILVNDYDISSFGQEDYQKWISVLFQDTNPMAFSVKVNVGAKKEENIDQEKIEESLKKTGIWDKIEGLTKKENTYYTQTLDKEGVTFSGGESQKLMLARAIYKDGPILILDEPTSALDPIAESRMYEEYHHMSENKTAVFISHRLASTKFCDRILYMEAGQIVEEGSHYTLMSKNGKYKGIFNLQSQYYKEEKQDGCQY